MDLKAEVKLFWTRVQAYSLWIVVCVVLGFWLGLQYGRALAKDRFDEATKVGGMVYESKIYDIKERQQQ